MEKTLDEQLYELDRKVAHCNTEKYALQMEQIKLLNKKYENLFEKKVQYVVKPLFKDNGSTIHYGYLKGFRLVRDKISPIFYRVKKDGTQSKSVVGCAYWIGEIESITLA